MSTSSPTANPIGARPLSLDQLVALCDEIVALARAGVPLDRGLILLGQDLPGRLGQVANEMGNELAAGMTLDQLVGRTQGRFPPGYQALLQAGIRAGNLPGVLQGISQLARRTGELRRQMVLAAITPLLVVAMTYVLFLFWLAKLAPVYLDICADWEMNIGPAEFIVRGLQQSAWLWQPLFPLVILATAAIAWVRAGQGRGEWSIVDLFTLGIVGGIGRMRLAGEYASLCDQLAILLSHGLPLGESLELISATFHSRPLAQATKQFADQLHRGELKRPPAPFPPLLACMLLDGYGQRDLITNLQQMATSYYDEVRRRSTWLSTWAPALLTLFIGGALTLFHALVTLGPWLLLMKQMSDTV
ncbi:type II secretion system F family protein [Anatilimnocola sp. NA78]|uniref:type II secretion system F family protein n=1 Tax=Anatilimnocola sp. NA78 TaxID=3415683 RepID=UPI003CE51971